MRFLPLLLLAALLTPGCANECDSACDAMGEYVERCLDTWATTWEEQSYDDRQDYVARCSVVYADELDDLDEGSEEHSSLLAICDANRALAESDTDCETLLE